MVKNNVPSHDFSLINKLPKKIRHIATPVIVLFDSHAKTVTSSDNEKANKKLIIMKNNWIVSTN